MGFDLASRRKELLLKLDVRGVSASETWRGGKGKTTYLVRRHIKVNLGGTRWARLVPAVLVHSLTCKDKVRKLLDARVEIFHRFALVQLLRVLSIGFQAMVCRKNYLACREATVLLWCLRFLLFLCKAVLELFDLLSVPLKQRVGVDNFFLLGIQLYLLDALREQ